MFLELLVFFLLIVNSADATLHAAKRSIGNGFCGFSPVDCGNGWCCINAMKCIPSDPPMCEDLLIPSFTIEAAPYSDLDPARLTSIGLTISTFPSATLTATDSLPTYSDSVETTLGSRSLLFTKPTTLRSAIATTPRDGAASPIAVPIHIVGGIVAACAGLW